MAQVYPVLPTDRNLPYSRRHPFTNSVNTKQRLHSPPPPKPPKVTGEKKKPGSPPLPRQNAKVTPPSPPKVICDSGGRYQLTRVGLLGEGGFARVYEVKSLRGNRVACKVVTKDSLKTKKAKTKLYAEIKIHKSLEHPNIVRFDDCFDDDSNVYMTLELCTNGSLMDVLRRRRRFTEPEVRYYVIQLVGACNYMHIHQVIHRDLKLGNLFLDTNMDLKVGDFGLAALIENPGERKKTVCGTPNYIAPEVLFDTANGHSFEVDTWSIGVILYTLLVGRPPFQTSEVKEIYQRIRNNVYDFPPERPISTHAQNLITQILTPDPQLRPTLHQIIDHPFFTQGTVPSYIPVSSQDKSPDFRNISKMESQTNLRRLRRAAILDIDQLESITPKSFPEPSTMSLTRDGGTSSIAQQEKEFQRAVQPGSPISALLCSARQPLLMASSGSGQPGAAGAKDNLLRKLQAAKGSPLSKKPVTRTLDGTIEEGERDQRAEGTGRMSREKHYASQEEELRIRKKELEAQKARIVAQMAPVKEEDELDAEEGDTEDEWPLAGQRQENQREREGRVKERENVPPLKVGLGLSRGREREFEKARTASKGDKQLQHLAPISVRGLPTATSTLAVSPQRQEEQLSAFDAAANVLTLAFDAKAQGRVFHDPRENPHALLPEERVFIVSWVDYCNKYGMGYALTDGSVGVHFNDSTSIVLSADKQHFDYISSRKHSNVSVRKSYTVEMYPEELKSKVYLLKHFERYIMDRLYGDYEYTFEDVDRTSGMEWVQKYLRMKHVIVFKLSHDVLQFNFYDHSKIILSSNGLVLTHIDKNYRMSRWHLREVMELALQPPSAVAHIELEVLKLNGKLVDKLKYCKEVLLSIRSASARGAGLEGSAPTGPSLQSIPLTEATDSVHGGGFGSDIQKTAGIMMKTSKMSLR